MGLRKDSYSNPVSCIKQESKATPVSCTATAEAAYDGVETARLSRQEKQKEANTFRVPGTDMLARMWRNMVAEHHPDWKEQSLTKAEAAMLRQYALSYCKQGKRFSGKDSIPFENFSKYMGRAISYWPSIVANTLFWMSNKPSNEISVGLFCAANLREKYERFLEIGSDAQLERRLSPREDYRRMLIQQGRPEDFADTLVRQKYGTPQEEASERILKLVDKVTSSLLYGIITETKLEQMRNHRKEINQRIAKYKEDARKQRVSPDFPYEDQVDKLDELLAKMKIEIPEGDRL